MELDELQKKVQNEFGIIKASKIFAKEDYQESVKNAGCLMTPFIPLIERYAKKTLKKDMSKRSHDIYEIEAVELLKNPELKKEICTSLLLITKGEILTEENFVNYVTAILFENKIRNKFVIPLEPALFAYIAYDISEKGINNFCSENVN